MSNDKSIEKDQVDVSGLDALAVSAKNNEGRYEHEAPSISILETFQTPSKSLSTNPNGCEHMVNITVAEFTSLCPLTKQPDFATILIDYVPDSLCVESKAIKLYMGAFRNHGEFHESCVNRICNDLVTKLRPKWIRVIGFFTPRGGIPIHPTAIWSQEDYELPTDLRDRLRNDPRVPYAPL